MTRSEFFNKVWDETVRTYQDKVNPETYKRGEFTEAFYKTLSEVANKYKENFE